jgi:hypothetical protein
MKMPDGTGINGQWHECNIVSGESLDSKIVISPQD